MANNRIIINGGIAKRLLMRGHILADLKPNRDNQAQSVYVFFTDKFLNEDINEVMHTKSNDISALKKRYQELNISESEYRKLIFEEYINAQVQAVT